MIKIGITGGIGSGKSVVAELLKIYGIPVYVADTESKALTNRSAAIREQLVALFGPEAYTPAGLNRNFLAGRIFTCPDLLRKVNAIIHPEVKKHYLAWAGSQTAPVTALESAVLFESGFDRAVDRIVAVYAPEEIRLERAVKRGNTSAQEIRSRMKNQLDEEIKKEKASFVIYNDGKQALIPQISRFLSTLDNSFTL